MDFSLNESQSALRQSMLHLARTQLNEPTLSHSFREKWKVAGAHGLLGMLVPAELGGLGLDAISAAIALEALGEACTDQGFLHAMCTQVIASVHISRFCTRDQQIRILPPLCRGELVLAQAMTEPNAGSDTASISTSAVPIDGGFLLNGRKCYVSNAPICDVAIVFAVTDPGASAFERTSCFLVDTRAAGVRLGPAVEKMGLETLTNGDVILDDVRLDAGTMVGNRGAGQAMFKEAIEWERILLFAVHIGKLDRIVRETARHARTRRQFGQPIASFQAISHRIADMRVNLELGRLMIRKAAWLKANGRNAALEAAVCKLFVSESLKLACLDAVQIRGAAAYMTKGGAEVDLRDAIAATLYSGTSEIQRNIIAALTI